MVKNFLLWTCALIGLPGLVGCADMTPAERVADAELIGLEDGGGRAGTAVISYQVPGTDRDAHFILPLDGSAGAAEPFVYHGTKRSPVDILLDVSAAQRQRILAARLVPAPGGAEVPSCGDERITRATSRPAGRTWSTTFRPFPREGLVVVAIGPAGSSLPRAGRWEGDHAGRGVVFPDNCVILILPDEHPRAAKELARARTKAIVAAPFEIAGAVVFIPPVLALYGLAYVINFGNLPRC